MMGLICPVIGFFIAYFVIEITYPYPNLLNIYLVN